MKKGYGIIASILLWYILSFVTNEVIPFPHEVIINFFQSFGILKPHILASSKRLFIGLIVSIVLGVHLGILLGIHQKSNEFVSPVLYYLYPIPKAALTPIFILLFGIGDLSKILLIIFISVFPVIINTKDAVKNINIEIFYASKSLHLNRLQMYKDIIIPAILPQLFTTLRIVIGTSVAVLYLSENFATFNGLGYFISLNVSIDNLMMFTGIFALSLIGYLLFITVDFFERRLCKWM